MTPDQLPPITDLHRRTQSLAMLDAILCPEWESRYYSFNRRWSAKKKQLAMASMRNGSGDEWFLLFDGVGAALKGFAHESKRDPTLPRRIQEQVPAAFAAFLKEPAFSMQEASFCFWRGTDDAAWHKVEGTRANKGSNDGSDELLHLVATGAGPRAYQEWAEDYLERPVSIQAVKTVFAHKPLSDAFILKLNPDADLPSVRRDADEIGYPAKQDKK